MKAVFYAFWFFVGCLIGKVLINTLDFEGLMAATGVLITVLLVAWYIRMGRRSK